MNYIQKYWMVHNLTRGGKHVTKLAAEQEAQRLSRLLPDQTFVVLEAVCSYLNAPPSIPPNSIPCHTTLPLI